jgi:hypothetical protein
MTAARCIVIPLSSLFPTSAKSGTLLSRLHCLEYLARRDA